ncbi:MAG: PEP-CTERM sorting domain-containing protein [Akkermansiaceae bacterium]
MKIHLANSSSANWKSIGLVLAASTALSQATIVQIGLNGNRITSGGGNSLNADLTGDAVSDVVFSNDSFGIISTLSSNGNFASVDINMLGNEASYVVDMGQPTSALEAGGVNNSNDELIPITFTDANYGGNVNAWLDVHVEFFTPMSGNGQQTGVYLERVIFDNSDLLNRPTVRPQDPDYDRAPTVPEPSSLALLAIGAGSLLVRRKKSARSHS